jgi:AcrR family transcriptional regulator
MWPLIILGALALGPLGEELGWRGFALPRLLDLMPALPASLLLGVVWWAWHLPAFWLGVPPFDTISSVPHLLSAVLMTIMMTGVYLRTGNSVLLSGILVHTVVNASLCGPALVPVDDGCRPCRGGPAGHDYDVVRLAGPTGSADGGSVRPGRRAMSGRPRASRHQVLAAAATILAVRPHASMQEIAAAADLHRATLYRHFTDREQLLHAVITQVLTEATGAVTATEEQGRPGWAALHRATVALVEVGTRYLGLVGGFTTDDPDLLELEARLNAALHRIVERAQQEHEVRTTSIRAG